MEQLLEIIYQRFKSGDLKAGEDLYNMCREAMKTDVSLGVKWLKILSEDISTQIGTCQNEETLRTLFALHKRVLLAAAPHDFDSYLLYVEWNREPDKKFYPPRRKVLKRVVDAMQELADDDSSYRRRQTAMPPSLLTITKQKPHRYNTDGVLFYQLTNPDEQS